MGKVASTAIVKSVEEYGLKASQPHFLTMEAFITLLRKFGDPEITHFAATNVLGQIQKNVITHNKIQRQKRYHYRDEKGSPMLKIITLAREPIGWYLSNLSQNYPEYERDIEDWQKYSQISGSVKKAFDKKRLLIRFINEVIDFFNENIPRLDEDAVWKLAAFLNKESADYLEVNEILVKHCFMLIRPIVWFKEHFDPVIGTHFEEMSFDKNRGYSSFEKDCLDILVIRFEDLTKIGPKVIGDFLGIKNFKMKKQNISEKKEVGAMISKSIKHLNFLDEFLNKIYNSDYCSKFYTPRHITEFKNKYL
jgi:hypothetical protein